MFPETRGHDPVLLLSETLQKHSELAAIRELLDTVVRTVVHFSGSEQEDDLTLLVARGLAPEPRS